MLYRFAMSVYSTTMVMAAMYAMVWAMLVCVASSELALVDMEGGTSKSSSGNDNDLRFLQLDTGNVPDLQAADDVCQVVAPNFECFFDTRVTATDQTYSDLEFEVICKLDSEIGFDYRRSQECECEVTITPSESDRERKKCPCVVCPYEFGVTVPVPASIDCTGEEEDPYIISTCTSLDCAFACNGTCSFGCDEPDAAESCDFCQPETEPPTQAPAESAASLAFIPSLAVIGSAVLVLLIA